MAAKDGSNGAWHSDTMGVALLLSLLHFMCLANKRLEIPGITKVRGFRRYANLLVAIIKYLYNLYEKFYLFGTASSKSKVFVIT